VGVRTLRREAYRDDDETVAVGTLLVLVLHRVAEAVLPCDEDGDDEHHHTEEEALLWGRCLSDRERDHHHRRKGEEVRSPHWRRKRHPHRGAARPVQRTTGP